MRVKKGLLLNKVGDDYVVVATNTDIFKGMLKLNESGAMIFNNMQEDVTLDQLVDIVLAEYEAEREQVEKDVVAFVESFKKVGLIEE